MDATTEAQARRKACEECRRLKLKCDRKFPCHSCVRRGCAAICPSGTFMKGTRSLKTNSLKLHETITEMSSRIRQLEEALSGLQAQVSTDPHPLLEENAVKNPLVPKPSSERPANEEETEVLDSLGTFTIGDKGEVMFHEATATSEYLLQVHDGSTPAQFAQTSQGSLSLPPDLVLLSVLFPFPPETVTTRIDDFVPFLPPFSEAVSICEMYFANSAWCQNPMPRETFMNLIFHECYPKSMPAATLDNVSSHRLSVLFMVMSLGTLMDPRRPICSVEAEEYHTLARACLCVEPVYDNSTLQAVQSMHLMIWYYTLAAPRRSNGYRLAIWGVVIRLCQAACVSLNAADEFSTALIGFSSDHDTRKLPLDIPDAKLRELVYWEVMCFDFWQAFVIGRPPSVSFNTADCKRPFDLRAVSDDPSEAAPVAWWAWKHEYTFRLNGVIDQAFRTKGTTYSQILTLDQKLRTHPVPSLLWWPTSQDALNEKLNGSPGLAMQRYMRLNLQESSLLHLHRRFFMQAIRANPEDPLQHQFGHSVRAVFSSACEMISGLCNICLHQPGITHRFPIAWSHGFSAAIVLSSLIISSPAFVLAQPAMNELDRACALFQGNAKSLQPPNATVILQDMQRKAHAALEEQRRLSSDPLSQSNDASTPKPDSISFSDLPSFTNGPAIHNPWLSQTTTPQAPNMTDDWRQYATPAPTPPGEQAWSQDTMIHVDISPEEPSTEQSNWESFIHQLGEGTNVQ